MMNPTFQKTSICPSRRQIDKDETVSPELARYIQYVYARW
jgi:hypothetical protein